MSSIKIRWVFLVVIIISSVLAGAFGAKEYHRFRMANLRAKYTVLQATSPQSERVHELGIMEATRRIAKKSGYDAIHIEKGRGEALKFFKEIEERTGENTLLYYESDRAQWSQGYLVVDFFGNVVDDIDATQIRKADEMPQ